MEDKTKIDILLAIIICLMIFIAAKYNLEQSRIKIIKEKTTQYPQQKKIVKEKVEITNEKSSSFKIVLDIETTSRYNVEDINEKMSEAMKLVSSSPVVEEIKIVSVDKKDGE